MTPEHHRPFRAVYARPVSSPGTRPEYVPSAEDAALVAALRAGDEHAFMRLVEEYGPQMLAVAMLYTPTRAVAEDVVGETWLAVLDGLDRFEGRSSLKTCREIRDGSVDDRGAHRVPRRE